MELDLVAHRLTFRGVNRKISIEAVSYTHLKAAIRLNDYFEESYMRIRSFVANDSCEDPAKMLLSMLPDTFDTKTAITVGKERGQLEQTKDCKICY